MRVFENVGKFMNYGIIRYFYGLGFISVVMVYRGKIVIIRKIDLWCNVIEKCLYICDYILNVYLYVFGLCILLLYFIKEFYI